MSKPKRICSIEGCERAHWGLGWCRIHYRRWKAHGDPLYVTPRSEWGRPPRDERFWAKVDVREPNECWPWLGGRDRKGYGQFHWPNGHLAHRFAYELLVGPIPEGLQLDHVKAWGCTSRACCNPAHLEPVTARENLLRGNTFQARNVAKTHCPHGHPYSGDNLILRSNGWRLCRECQRRR